MITINTQRLGKTTILSLKGRMDSASKANLLGAVERELDRKSQIILNLEGVDYLSTSGLKILRKLDDETGSVRIAEPSRRVREVLQITGLNDQYTLYPKQTQAIRAVNPIVNAHTHLEFGWLDDLRPNVIGEDFTDWILNSVGKASRALGSARNTVTQVAVEKGIQALIDSGTTTVCDISTLGLSIEPLFDSGLDGIIYIEVLGLREEQAQERFAHAKSLLETWRSKERNGMRLGLSIHSPYSIAPKFWTPWLDFARKEALPLCIHVAESLAEHDLLTKGTGAFADYMKTLNLDFTLPQKSPIAYLEDIGALDLKPLLIHGVQVDDADIQRIKQHHCTMVHCPRSNLRLQCGRMPLEKYLDADIPVYLGTDSLGSSPSLNVLDELEVAIALHHGKVDPAKIEALIYTPLPIASSV